MSFDGRSLTELEVSVLLLQSTDQTLKREHPPAGNRPKELHEDGKVKSVVVVRSKSAMRMQLQQRLAQDKAAMEEEDETQFEAEHEMLDAMLLQRMRDIEKHRPSGATWRMSQNVRTSAGPFKEDIAEAEEMESREKFKNTREEKKKVDKEQDAAEAAKNRAEEWQSLRNCFERHEDGKPSLAGVRPAFEAFRIRAQARRGKAGVEAQETTTEAPAQGPN